MTFSQPLWLIEIGRPWQWYPCQIANENGIWKVQLVLFSLRRSALLNDLHISAFQAEVLNALEYITTLQHLQKISAKWPLLELAVSKASEGPSGLEMQSLTVARGKGYGSLASRSLHLLLLIGCVLPEHRPAPKLLQWTPVPGANETLLCKNRIITGGVVSLQVGRLTPKWWPQVCTFHHTLDFFPQSVLHTGQVNCPEI